MRKIGKYYIVHEDEMDELLLERDRYQVYKVVAEIREEDRQRETVPEDDP